MAVVWIITTIILAGIIGIMAYLMFKSKRPIIGKAKIPSTVQESQIMEMLGEANEKLNQYKELLKKYMKEKEIKLSVNEEIRKRLIKEKKEILKEGILLLINSKKPYKVIGYDGSNYGNLRAIVLNKDGEKAWIYYQREEIIDIIGGKPLANIIKYIDKEQKIIFIQYNKDQKLIPKQYERI